MKHVLILIAIVIVAVGAYTFTQQVQSGQTTIRFVGMATGTLASDVNNLTFSNKFSKDDHELVGVVAFDSIPEGSVVQATWFSPDDRRMPLGRKEIITASGAKVAKFSIANSASWEPSPYMLDIYVYSRDYSHVTASGSTNFFIGMKDEDIASYMQEYATYKHEERMEQWRIADEQRADEELLASISKENSLKKAGIALKIDASGDGSNELFITDPAPDPNLPPVGDFLISTDVNNAIIYSKANSGSVLFALKGDKKQKTVLINGATEGEPLLTKKPVKFTIPSEKTMRLEWTEGTDACSWNFRYGTGAYVTTDRSCAKAS